MLSSRLHVFLGYHSITLFLPLCSSYSVSPFALRYFHLWIYVSTTITLPRLSDFKVFFLSPYPQ